MAYALDASFWDDEKECKLMEMGSKWLRGAIEDGSVQPRVQRWLEMAGVSSVPPLPEPSESKDRIFAADAERTWVTPPHRSEFAAFLQFLRDKFGDYHQGLGYAASWLVMVMPVDRAFALLARMNEDEKYVLGYWKAAPEAYVRDAFVYARLLQENFPAAEKQLSKFGLVAESYASKWFVALSIHILPFRALMDFFDAFLEKGYVFLFRFAMALMRAVEPKIMECTATQIDKMSKLVRLDRSLFPVDEDDFFCDIVRSANTDYDEIVTQERVDSLREEEMVKLQERMQKAREREARMKAEEEEDEITFSDED